MHDLFFGINRALAMPCQCTQHGPLCPMKELACMLERVFLQEKRVWRRRDMCINLQRLKTFAAAVQITLQATEPKPHLRHLAQVLNDIIDF